jgi:hypothetical protein
MKKEIQLSKIFYWILPALAVFGMASCKKSDGLGFTPGTGAPTVSNVKTISKTTQDTVLEHTITYSSSGVVTVTTDTNKNHKTITAFDSTTVTGNLGNIYVVNGTNLGSATSLALNGVPVYFNRGLITDNSIIFTIPVNIPYVQPQSNTLTITTLHGTVKYKFTTLPPPPTIIQVSDFDFWSNSKISMIGKGFASVSAVKLRATNEACTIVSQTDTTLTIQMPAKSTATESTLLFTYTSGSNTNAQAASTAVFNNLDLAYQIFASDKFQNSWGDNSWAGPSGVSTNASHSGTASARATYPAGAWQIEGWVNWYPSIAYDPAYKYLSFWVKGGTVDHTLVLVGDKMVGGYNQVQWGPGKPAYKGQQVVVPAKVWTFVKIPLTVPSTPYDVESTLLNFWATGSPAAQLGFFLQGSSGDVDEAMYFDEVAFLK